MLPQLNHTLNNRLFPATAQQCTQSIPEVRIGVFRAFAGDILGGVTKDQPIEIGVISQWVQVVIVLCTHPQVWLQIQRLLQ